MKLVIVGGGAGGPTAAARARRLDESAQIIMFERGEHVSYAHCGLPYYIGGVIEDREKLLVAPLKQFKERYGIKVRTHSEVKAIIPDSQQIEVVNLRTGMVYRERYDKLVLSPGADPIRPPLPGIDTEGIFTLRNLTDADTILKFITEKKPKKAVVVGGGYIGLEMAENLRHRGIGVTVVEMLEQVLLFLDPEMAEIVKGKLQDNGIELALSDPVASFSRRDGQIIVRVKSGAEIPCDMVMLSIGVKPNVGLARSAGLEIGERGGIRVNEYMQTSAPNIYAVGDAVETMHIVPGELVVLPLAGPANRQARIAVDNIYGRGVAYRGILGTGIIKLFDVTAASTGANEKLLKQRDIPYEKCYLHPFSHANYYPGASQMALKVLFSSYNGRLLGVQIVGDDGVDKRIDVFATAIMAGMTVDDLTQLELGYVPQYGSAKDAVNMAGYVASNIFHGDVPVVHWDELDETGYKEALLLDVRREDEFKEGAVPGAKNIPLDKLRSRLNELSEANAIYPYCAAGQRSYMATRILGQRGFKVKNVSGGFRSYKKGD
ncbi:CoA-disulfide reductase [Chloroflexota bacterium]